MNLPTGGQNPHLQTPGKIISIVVKHATDAFQGHVAVYGTHHSVESSTIEVEPRHERAGTGTPLKHLALHSIDALGPIVRDFV